MIHSNAYKQITHSQLGNHQVTASHQITSQIVLKDVIADAIRNQNFHMVYQPQFSVITGRLMGFEALIRCQSTEFGLISPVDFIPYAEESGDIIEIGRWIFKQSLLDLKKFQCQGLAGISMSVNLSPAQLAAGDVFESLMMHILELDLSPRDIKVELTETALIHNARMAARTFSAFRDEGISVWLDDFGTGFASLNLLRDFNIDGLKIDKSFVDGIHRHDNDFTLCSAIIAMAQRLGLEVIAEGVEDDLQMQILGQLGCDSIQGYLMGKPERYEDCLKRWVKAA